MKRPYEYPWDRVKPYRFYWLGVAFMWICIKIWYRVRVVGKEHLPKHVGGHILVCNHYNSIDPSFLVVALGHRWRFIGKKELFQHSRLNSWVITRCNAFPVDRNGVDRQSLDYAVAVVRDGRAGLGIFPEGKRSPDGNLLEPKTGVAMIARQAKANIIPAAIIQEDRKLRFGSKLTIRVGEVLPFEELGLGESPNKRETHEACELMMRAISRLKDQGM